MTPSQSSDEAHSSDEVQASGEAQASDGARVSDADQPDQKLLTLISDQLAVLADRVRRDIDANAKSRDTSGFLLYYLTDSNGEPLKSTQTDAASIQANDIEMTSGYSFLRDQCHERSAELRLDQHYYSDDPKPTTIFRIIVDGWS